MSMWLYQLSEKLWEPQRYRAEIWEAERWSWEVGRQVGAAEPPRQGDTVVFFYAPAGGRDPGFYGWAVITEWLTSDEGCRIYFRPVAPSDHLKMHPWWDKEAEGLANQIRGTVKMGTLWRISENLSASLRRGITRWVSGQLSSPGIS